MRKEKEIPGILLPALRQYQHNDGSGLITGFDHDETVRIVNLLLETIEAQSNASREGIMVATDKKSSGFTLIELLIVMAIVSIVCLAVFSNIINNRAATERRALRLCHDYIMRHDIKVKYVDCAGDSNNDGYGTCTIKTTDDKRIMLRCPTDYFDVEFWGARACKEIFAPVDMMMMMREDS